MYIFLLLLLCSQLTCAQNGKLLNVALYSTQSLINVHSGATTEITGFSTQNEKPFNMTFFRMCEPRQTIFTTVFVGGAEQTRITNFPNGTYTDTGEENSDGFLKVTIPTGADVSEKTGVFSFHVANDNGSANTSIVMQVSSASITPLHRTMTSALGEKVTIHMLTNQSFNDDLRWRINYGDVITEWNGLSNVTIDVVRLKDDGIYECYHEKNGTDGNHGIMRLIVRGCPSSRWNPPTCDKFCPVCYNGGVCNDVTGVCVCLSGFRGQQCKSVCLAGTFGPDCALRCSSTNDSCKGALICPSDPAGCSCGNGYGGIDCTKPCEDGWYGPGCNQMCNCDHASCDSKSGCSGNCSLPGYTEESHCQELMQNNSCPEGFYGDLCNHHCHCKYAQSCDRKSGNCAGGCEEGWGQEGNTSCSIALAVLSHPPRVVSRTNSSIIIDFTWSPTKDYGNGNVLANLLWYNISDNLTVHKTHVFRSNQHTISGLPSNSLVTFYVEHIQVLNEHIFHGPISPFGTTVTTCSEPLYAPSVGNISRTPNEITVTLKVF
ncbi:uncharacterized protein LOC117123582 [Anneissia japonica]|uniref:uncharacterized protein LOC117123582 n=1 Tax=Anneissia japonica TaxID=1529436 RepID=UPI0014259162|nr:uncharacterized protein LOC117123582 [Anneissia japonica]